MEDMGGMGVGGQGVCSLGLLGRLKRGLVGCEQCLAWNF